MFYFLFLFPIELIFRYINILIELDLLNKCQIQTRISISIFLAYEFCICVNIPRAVRPLLLTIFAD